MKTIIQGSQDSDYKLWAELTDCYSPKGHKLLKVTSQWNGARFPEEEQNQLTCILDEVGVAKLKELLGS